MVKLIKQQLSTSSNKSLNCGLTQAEVIEVVIQTGPYTGLAPVLMGLSALSA